MRWQRLLEWTGLTALPPDWAEDLPIQLPQRGSTPARQVTTRVLIGIIITVAMALLVWLDGDGYRDLDTRGLTFIAALYYSTVSLSTTGYGDITPVSDFARMFNVIAITPLRILFLVTLVGTTLEILTERSRTAHRTRRWRQHVNAHTVVIGFGVKGRAAVQALLEQGILPSQIVAIYSDPAAVEAAGAQNLISVLGDARSSKTLKLAEIGTAQRVVVALSVDADAVLVTLSARRLNPSAQIVTSARETDTVDLLRSSGANAVVTSAESAGRLLGMSAAQPHLGVVIQDLLVTGTGLDLVERAVTTDEVGKSTAELPDNILTIVRDGQVRSHDDPQCHSLLASDRLVIVASIDI